MWIHCTIKTYQDHSRPIESVLHWPLHLFPAWLGTNVMIIKIVAGKWSWKDRKLPAFVTFEQPSNGFKRLKTWFMWFERYRVWTCLKPTKASNHFNNVSPAGWWESERTRMHRNAVPFSTASGICPIYYISFIIVHYHSLSFIIIACIGMAGGKRWSPWDAQSSLMPETETRKLEKKGHIWGPGMATSIKQWP